ncbi:hypothetical protein IKE19_00040 [Candidatus Saccharibacteria bacterium]|nr:hypothetical protein [Candidatus Saccharibacteria bacterium]
MIDTKTEKSLRTNLKRHAHALGIPIGAAELFIDRSIAAAQKSLADKSIITERDLIRAVSKELRKYSRDLAYVYENYDKII